MGQISVVEYDIDWRYVNNTLHSNRRPTFPGPFETKLVVVTQSTLLRTRPNFKREIVKISLVWRDDFSIVFRTLRFNAVPELSAIKSTAILVLLYRYCYSLLLLQQELLLWKMLLTISAIQCYRYSQDCYPLLTAITGQCYQGTDHFIIHCFALKLVFDRHFDARKTSISPMMRCWRFFNPRILGTVAASQQTFFIVSDSHSS